MASCLEPRSLSPAELSSVQSSDSLNGGKRSIDPASVRALDGKNVVSASCGKAHTVLVTAAGGVLACGATQQGCVGSGAPKKAESAPSPIAVAGLASITHVASGGAFNLARDEDGEVWSWGWSEYGVLGNGDDH